MDDIFVGPVTIINWAQTRRQKIIQDLSFESEAFDVFKPNISSCGTFSECKVDAESISTVKSSDFKEHSTPIKTGENTISDTSSLLEISPELEFPEPESSNQKKAELTKVTPIPIGELKNFVERKKKVPVLSLNLNFEKITPSTTIDVANASYSKRKQTI